MTVVRRILRHAFVLERQPGSGDNEQLALCSKLKLNKPQTLWQDSKQGKLHELQLQQTGLHQLRGSKLDRHQHSEASGKASCSRRQDQPS